MDKIIISKEIPKCASYDCIVAGGGVAGVAAAVSAARMGLKVLLLEKTISLGGLATIGLVNLFVPMCNGHGKQIIKGMAEEFLQLSIKYGFDTIPEVWKNGEPKEPTDIRYLSRFSAPVFTLALTELIKNEGVDILYDTVVCEPIMDGYTCRGLVVENKSGMQYYEGKIIIDTTGDADILYRAGVPTVQGGNFHTFYGYMTTLANSEKFIETKDVSKLYHAIFGGRSDLYGRNHPEGKALWRGTNGRDVTNYVVENHIEMLNEFKKYNRAENDIVQIPTMPQFRTTRHIDGDYTLKETDAYKHFDDSIAAICDFDRSDYLYEVPYGTLVKSGFPNLITAGRTASGEGYGWDVLRVIPPAIITGQAAGIAAYLSIKENCGIDKVNVSNMQKILSEQNVMIHFDDSLIPKDRGGKKVQIGHI